MAKQTQDKIVFVKPAQGMSEFQEALSLADAEFRKVSGTYPLEAGIQSRIPGKVYQNNFGCPVLAINDFLGNRIIQTNGAGVVMQKTDGSFATLQSSGATQIINRDTFAASSQVQLGVRANGEEFAQVIDLLGNITQAVIPIPSSTAITFTQVTGGTLQPIMYYGYGYCWVAGVAYPNIALADSINGEICPRGNPLISATPGLTTSTKKTLSFTLNNPASTRLDLDRIWVFRTTAYSDQTECQNATNAGLMFFIDEILVTPGTGGTQTFTDTGIADGVDQIENDNYGAPLFKNVIYFDPYWLGFATDNFVGSVTRSAGQAITLNSGNWYNGRDGQSCTLDGVLLNGRPVQYNFKYLTGTTGTLQNGISIPNGTYTIRIGNPETTIYRSKEYDPFAWGWTRTIGISDEALTWAVIVGGGIGTAIATLPDEAILVVDTENPTRSYSFSLQVIDDLDTFKQTKKQLSDTYSVTNQACQFAGQSKDGSPVLWGYDYKSYSVLACNGVSRNIVSYPIQRILRSLTADITKQIWTHGCYDPYTQCNCLWLTLPSGPSSVHFMVYQHAPTGFWGVMEDLDVLCSCKSYDPNTKQTQIMLGTESGLYGQGFTPNTFQNWVDNSNTLVGTISAGASNSITCATTFGVTNGLIGTWVLVTDSGDQTEQWARISAVAGAILTIDRVYTVSGGQTNSFPAIPSAGFKYYIGLIECRLLKYFDFGIPNTDKRWLEMEISQQNSQGSLVRVTREWETTILKQFTPQQIPYFDTTPSSVFISKKDTPTEMIKSYGVEVINREYEQWIFRNMVLRHDVIP